MRLIDRYPATACLVLAAALLGIVALFHTAIGGGL
ncbi:hypothetical protein DFO67_13519 [Modicisalibacter xianhensis]|uniref:Uncharacterized protein n=1 Tax=Modicisalibacter xianhensis TaxID=442341 RepID=A0A4R8F880_9GAMM|nr:hypothetical protein DFO67_13519 [Halomonas xianhensis]